MTTDYIEEDPKPQKIGRCNIDVGGNRPAGCGVAILDNDLDAIDLGKDGMICGKCYRHLFNARPWSSQLNTAGSAAQSAGGRKSKALNNPFMQLPGSKDFQPRAKRSDATVGGLPRKERRKRG